jgi:AraC-like DNA-binding protein
MKTFYELHRDQGENLSVNPNTAHDFPAHFHASLEIFLLKKGRYELTCNGEKREVGNGSVCVIDSFQIHAYQSKEEVGEDCVLLVPPSLLSSFYSRKDGRKIENAFLQDSALCNELLSIVNAYLLPPFSQNVKKAGVELVLALLLENLQFSNEKQKGEEGLVREILSFIHGHYQEKISRETLAKKFAYAPEHISRVFHRYVGKTLSEYINGLRLDYVEQQRRNGDKRTEIELLYEAGFQSQQTYYRQKAKRKAQIIEKL